MTKSMQTTMFNSIGIAVGIGGIVALISLLETEQYQGAIFLFFLTIEFLFLDILWFKMKKVRSEKP